MKKASGNSAPDKIHDVRTSTRRLESALDTLQIKKKGLKKRLQRDLQKIRKRCGKLRDMDVLTGHAMAVRPEEGERKCLVQLVEYLGVNRYKHARKLQAAAKQYGPALRDDLDKLAKEVDKLSAQNRRNGNGAGTEGQNPSALLDLGAELHLPALLDKKNLHPYRLKVKELRYALQLSEEAQDDEFVDVLGNVKDAIGEWHDWEELVGISIEAVGHGPQCKLLRQLKKISREKFEEALEITNKMRDTYVNERRGGKNDRGKPVAFPVKMAQAAARGCHSSGRGALDSSSTWGAGALRNPNGRLRISWMALPYSGSVVSQRDDGTVGGKTMLCGPKGSSAVPSASQCSACGRQKELFELPGRTEKYCLECSADVATSVLLAAEIDAANKSGEDTGSLVAEFLQTGRRLLARAQLQGI